MLERREDGISKMCSVMVVFMSVPGGLHFVSLFGVDEVAGRSPRTAFGVRYRTSSVLQLR
jgi:hypothetical protein